MKSTITATLFNCLTTFRFINYKYYILFFLLHTFCFAQRTTADSLKAVLSNTKTETERYEALANITEYLHNTGAIDNSKVFFDEFITLSKKRGDYKNLAKAYRIMSWLYVKAGKKKEAFASINMAEQVNDSIPNDLEKLKNILFRGNIHTVLREFKEAVTVFSNMHLVENYASYGAVACIIQCNLSVAYMHNEEKLPAINSFLQTLECLEANPRPATSNTVLINLGAIYKDMGQYPKAEKYLLQALENAKTNNLPQQLGDIYAVLSANARESGNYDKANDYAMEAITEYTKTGDKLGKYNALIKLTTNHSSLGNFESSIAYAKQSLQLSEEIDYGFGTVTSKLNLAGAYNAQKKYKQAERYLTELIPDTNKYRTYHNHKYIFYKTATVTYEGLGNDKKALQYSKRITVYNDSLMRVNKDKEFADIETKYQTEKKENTILKQEKEILELDIVAERRKNWLFITLSVILIISITFYSLWKRAKVKRENLRRQLAENQKELTAFTQTLLQKGKEQELLSKELEYLKANACENQKLTNLEELVSSKILTYEDWENFKQKFSSVHPLFLTKIKEKYVDLTQSEKRLISLEKLGLKTQEIANMLGVSYKTIVIYRHRLRKKLNAPNDISIMNFINKAI